MRFIYAANVNEAWPQAYRLFRECGIADSSRAGEVIALPFPVMTQYLKPTQRVLFDPARDANPFFHFFEALWMLAGRRDLKFLLQFNKRMAEYSNDGKYLTGSAYGFQWRKSRPSLPHSQLDQVVRLLVTNPRDRRAVLQMWSPADLFDTSSKSVPCNTAVYFRNVGGELQMTVTCRSNDAIWGAYGSNVVHFSMLQEYVAARSGASAGCGSYYQLSNNFHVYRYNPYWHKIELGVVPDPDHGHDYYDLGAVKPYPMFDEDKEPQYWDRDLALFFEDPLAVGFEHSFWPRVVKPLWFAHQAYRIKQYEEAFEILGQCAATDWRLAADAWLTRRVKARRVP